MALLESRLARWPEDARLQPSWLDGPETLPAAAERVTLGVSPHALFTVSAPLFQKVAAFCAGTQLPCLHSCCRIRSRNTVVKDGSGPMMESYRQRGIGWNPPRTSPIAYLNNLGILNPGTLLVHCIRLESSDYDILSKQGVCVAHCPKSNARLRHGLMNLKAMREHHIPTGLGYRQRCQQQLHGSVRRNAICRLQTLAG